MHSNLEAAASDFFFSYFSRVTLVRRTLPGVFSFEYELPTPYNATVTPQSLDLENELPSVLQFEIGPSDIGGTLAVELQLDHNKVSRITNPFQREQTLAIWPKFICIMYFYKKKALPIPRFRKEFLLK